MAGEIVFYPNPMSRGRTIRWMLEEVGAAYRTEVLELGTPLRPVLERLQQSTGPSDWISHPK